MIDGLLSSLRRTGERVQRRGEEVAQSARLRLDIFQLGRELDALYARLGRAYHANASVSTLEEIRADIGRVEEEIAAREKLVTELGADAQGSVQGSETTPQKTLNLNKVEGPGQPAAVHPTAVQPQIVPALWTEKEATSMSGTKITGPTTDATGRPDGENADPTRTTGQNLAGQNLAGQNSGGNPTIPNSDKREVLGDKTASMGKEGERDKMDRHRLLLEEGKRASDDPDPLASKD